MLSEAGGNQGSEDGAQEQWEDAEQRQGTGPCADTQEVCGGWSKTGTCGFS